jgi:predicted ester cyclase
VVEGTWGYVMSTEENKKVVMRWIEEAWANKNLDNIDELHAPDYVGHIVGTPTIRGRQAFKQLFAAYFAAFDLHRTNEFLIAEGDKVVSYDTIRVKQIGEFAGIPATGKELTTTGIDIYRIVDSKIVEQWYEMDFTGMLDQLR